MEVVDTQESPRGHKSYATAIIDENYRAISD